MKKPIRFILFPGILVATWESRESICSSMMWISNRDAVAASMQPIGIWGPVTLFVFQVFLAFIPGQALMVAGDYLYGFWSGFLLSRLSLVAGGAQNRCAHYAI
jgi:uncharacterized membrane protein YdjX (TVP38/TMEM64 family)